MIDKALFIGSSGAKDSMRRLQMITNNLANVNTTGFRADLESAKQMQVSDKGQQSRVYSSVNKSYSDFQPGPILNTARDLDVAIAKHGFIAVQSKTGGEGYTRAGDLEINAGGFLVTKDGQLVLGHGGVINLPPSEKISIGSDGTVSARFKGTQDMVAINRIKLVNPSLADLHKGTDGLFYSSDSGGVSRPDESIRLIGGALEGSNVNPVSTLTDLIELSRQFEMHTNLMKSLQEDTAAANQLLQIAK